MIDRRKKVCLISSAGGHLEELRQLTYVMENYDIYFEVPNPKVTKKMKCKNYLIKDTYLDKSKKIRYFCRFIEMCFEQFVIFIKENPDVVVTTGAGTVIPTCMYAHLFKKKLICIQSLARINSKDRALDFLYKYADLYIVQWESQLVNYPDAVYGGWIF